MSSQSKQHTVQPPWIVVRGKHVPISFRLDRRVPLLSGLALLLTLAVMVVILTD